jgi:hypothetical protein
MLLVCTSCSPVGHAGKVSSESPPTQPRIFSTEKEALAAASHAYKRYFEVSDEIASRGGVGREEMAALVSAEFSKVTDQGMEDLTAKSLHTSGRTSVEGVTLQSLTERGGRAEVTIYACVDVTDVAVLNAVGDVVTPPDRPDRLSFVAELISDSLASPNLVLSNNVPWSGESFC